MKALGYPSNIRTMAMGPVNRRYPVIEGYEFETCDRSVLPIGNLARDKYPQQMIPD